MFFNVFFFGLLDCFFFFLGGGVTLSCPPGTLCYNNMFFFSSGFDLHIFIIIYIYILKKRSAFLSPDVFLISFQFCRVLDSDVAFFLQFAHDGLAVVFLCFACIFFCHHFSHERPSVQS